MQIETVRLLLRPPRLSDVPALYTFLGDAEAMRFTHVDGSLRQCRRRIAVHERRRRRDGCAPWTVLAKESAEIIGWGGLYEDPFDPGWGVEVGYYFRPETWGRGFASELMQASVDVADHVLALPEVGAFARSENTASRRILAKFGFEEVRFVAEMQRILYRRRHPSL